MNSNYSELKSGSCFRLVADIGGTHARFALLDGDDLLIMQHKFKCIEYPDIVNAINAYLSVVGDPIIEHAAIAIANPIDGDTVKMTNHHWTFSIEKTRRALKLKTLIFKNDLTALAMSIPKLPLHELRQLGGKPSQHISVLAVIAPGTGLGVSGLINAGNRWVPLQSEGGHVSLSPGNAREIAILEHCWESYEHVSAERVISGMGYQNLYRAICSLEGAVPKNYSAFEISQQALIGADSICKETLHTFCGILGSTAGNLVLTLGAFDGIYIGGGIVPSLGCYFDDSTFRARFEAKGRFRDRLSQVPVYIIQSENPVLQGIGQVFSSHK